MGRSGQIEQLLSDLPIDETWVLLGIAILAVAAISHLHTMWREARYGVDGGAGGSSSHPADRYFTAWKTAADAAGLQTQDTDDELVAPRLRGRLRGLPTDVEMKLQRGGRRDPNPEAINPATVHCRIDARIELSFPWHRCTVRQFIRPESVDPGDTDDVEMYWQLSGQTRIDSVRLLPRARQALTQLVDEFETVKIIDGTIGVSDSVQPSRNVHQWRELFEQRLRELRDRTGSFARAGVVLEVAASSQAMKVRIEPSASYSHRYFRVVAASEFDERGRAGEVEDSIRSADTTFDEVNVENRTVRVEQRLRHDGSEDDAVQRLDAFVEAVAAAMRSALSEMA